MHFKIRLSLFCSIVNYGFTNAGFSEEEIRTAVKNEDIVPDVVDTYPKNIVDVTYGTGSDVSLGNDLFPEKTSKEPTVSWKLDNEKFYLLVLIDPDSPTKTVHMMSEVNHWLVGNIPGTQMEKGEVMAEYRGPAPLFGIHRYIFLLYEQPNGNITFDESKSKIESPSLLPRLRFSIRKFAKKYNLGEPVAINYFTCNGRLCRRIIDYKHGVLNFQQTC